VELGITRKRIAILAAANFVLAVSPSLVQAAEECRGTISSTVMAVMPDPVVVWFLSPLDTAANPILSDAFVRGLQQAGITVAATGPGTVQLNLNMLITGSSYEWATGKTFRDFSWINGDPAPGSNKWNIRGSRLTTTIQATNTNTQTLAWIGESDCTIQINDPPALANFLGLLIGRHLGRSVAQNPF